MSLGLSTGVSVSRLKRLVGRVERPFQLAVALVVGDVVFSRQSRADLFVLRQRLFPPMLGGHKFGRPVAQHDAAEIPVLSTPVDCLTVFLSIFFYSFTRKAKRSLP